MFFIGVILINCITRLKEEVVDDCNNFYKENTFDHDIFVQLGITKEVFATIFHSIDADMCDGMGVGSGRNMSLKRGSYIYVLVENGDFGDSGVFYKKVYYAGKGSDGRFVNHLEETKWLIENGLLCLMGPKEQKILNDWIRGKGIIAVRGFDCARNCESLTREAAIIVCKGLDNLTNKNDGTLFGAAKSWDHVKLFNHGMFILDALFTCLLYTSPSPRDS